MSKRDNKHIGSAGEKLAVKYLKNNGYGILDTNFKTDIGEIDIVAFTYGTIVFVEVKTRMTTDLGLPAEAVDYRKQNKISAVASQYIKKNMLFGVAVRFDVIDIVLDDNDKVTHYVDAFDSYLKY